MSTTETPTDWVARAAALRPAAHAVIGDDRVPAADGRTFAAEAPRDGSHLADVARGGPEDVDRAVRAARRAFEDGPWRRDPALRRRGLLALADLVEAHRDELALLDSVDVGKPIGDTTAVDAPSLATTLRFYAEAIDKVAGEVPQVGEDLALVTREPLGVVGAVVPWNYALIITGWKLGPALAAGNCVVLKPAEHSALAAVRVGELAQEAGLPPGVLNVVPGLGEEAGAALGRHPDVDKVAFTGSVAVGRRFLAYSGESNGKQVSLELGGKSPHVVLDDVPDLDACAEAIGWGVFYNAGQTCHAGTRAVVVPEVREALLERLVAFAEGFQPADPLLPGTRHGAIVSAEQHERVLGWLRTAAEEGAGVAVGGAAAEPVPGGRYVQPTVLTGLGPGARTVREEVFGPVLVLQDAADADEAVRLANDTPFGLAAAVWTGDVTRAVKVSRALRAGTVWVNAYDRASIVTPFGGVGDSGFGRDRSLHALDAYTQPKTTWIGLDA